MKFSVTGAKTGLPAPTSGAKTLEVGGLPVTLFHQRTIGQARSTRILAFTATRGRPGDLLRCIHQMQSQTVHVDHSIFINHDPASACLDFKNYISLVERAFPYSGKIMMAYGKSARQHTNYLTALSISGMDYDLFLKVDDDDIYLPRYAENTLLDWSDHQWDFSGTKSSGWLDGSDFKGTRTVWHLGLSSSDNQFGVAGVMPPTYALTRRAVDLLFGMVDDGRRWEDMQWREHLARHGVTLARRMQEDFIYNRHGGNVSCPWLKAAKPPLKEMNSRFRSASRKDAIPDEKGQP